MGYSKIAYDVRDGVATIELNDPPANTYSYDMMREIDSAVLDARMDRTVSVIVLRGAGDKFFCAGANIGMLRDADPEFKYYFCLHANETLSRLEQTPKLVIAALNGHTVGGGLVGKARAIELMIAGRLMSFDDARAIGLVTEVWDEAALGGKPFAAAVHEYAQRFTPPQKASKAVGRIKRAVQSGIESGLAEGLALERELQQLLFESDDAREGIAANVEKRKPDFRGR
jgi:enoyl-CoA hydratase